MQLATSQRPHPPPVPPRPSRQVVAEALKRTARPPPCPTRQAPPPPNTRPWRHEDQETRVGRTVVYESAAREEEKQQQQSNGQKVRSHESQRPLASPRGCSDEPSGGGGGNNITANTVPAVVEKTEVRSGVGGVGGATRAAPSERNEAAENQRERQQQRRRSSGGGDQRCDRENSAIQLGATDAESGRCASDEKAAESGRPVETCFERKKDEANCDEKKPRVFDKSTSRICQETPKISERLDGKSLPAGLTSESIARSTEAVGRAEDDRNADDGRAGQRRSSSFGRTAADSQGEAAAAPTKIAKLPNAGVNNDKAGEARRANEEPIGRANDCAASGAAAATTISSDDCATVVVVDEPERKIAFSEDNDNIHHQDWLEAGIRYSSTKITLPGDDPVDRADEFGRLGDNRDEDGDYDNERRGYVKYDNSSICERIAMSSLQGLPPLPRSLSGFNLSEGRREAAEPPPPPARSSSKSQKNVKSTQPSSSRPSPPGRQLTTLDTQLAILRKEMFGLRQLDLSLLSQLWSLNESIQEFRQLLQEQEDRAPSPSPSSEEGDDNSYGSHPPPPPRRPAPLLHHHRPPRPPRPLRPPASDDSPSSEEYGAV